MKDPYSVKYPAGAVERNPWDRYARVMYDLMEDGEDQPETAAADGLDGGVLQD